MAKEKKIKKNYLDLPAWYRRLKSQPEIYDDLDDVSPYDEDISDLEEKEEKTFECHCEAAEDSDLECWCDSDDESVSERSYTGSDADCYYEMKEDREERKRELKEMREEFEKQKFDVLQFEKRMVEEVRAVYEALKQEEKEKGGSGPPITFLETTEYVTDLMKAGKRVASYMTSNHKMFKLYSADYIENCYRDSTGSFWTYVEFYDEDQSGLDITKGTTNEEGCAWKGKVMGHIYVNCDHQFEFSIPVAPDHASTRVYWYEPYKYKHKVGIQFIGEDYVRITVGRDVIEATEHDPLPASCPDVFEFMGINRKSPLLKAQEEEERQKKRAKHSPRESLLDSFNRYDYYY